MTNTSHNQYDYIIAGAGAAGLSLLVRMIGAGHTKGKKILLVDKTPKILNDRTWCFWENGRGMFEEIVHHSWQNMWFHSNGLSRHFSISPYRYKMIRGIDFYTHCFNVINAHPNITVLYGTVTEMQTGADGAWLLLDGQRFIASLIFNSIIFSDSYLQNDPHHLLQHFKGWNIETTRPVFEPAQATLMDFRVRQAKGAAFVYIMPFSTTTALVEYTLFSKDLLPQHEYDTALQEYIDQFITREGYKTASEEYGIIPMSGHRFSPRNGNIINIGTIGGQTKPSSGYTFQFIQEYTGAIVAALCKSNMLVLPPSKAKYHFYDTVLLNVLATGKLSGEAVFTRLFEKNPPVTILEFLDNKSTISKDLQLIASLPTLPFLHAAIQELL